MAVSEDAPWGGVSVLHVGLTVSVTVGLKPLCGADLTVLGV